MIGDFPQKQKQPKPMPPPSHLPIFPGQLSTTQRHVPRKLWSFWLTLGAPSMEQAKSEGGTKGGTSGSQKEEKTRLGCEYLLLIPWHTVGFLLWFQFKSTSLSLLWYWFLLPHFCLIINVYHPFDIFGRSSNGCGFSFIPQAGGAIREVRRCLTGGAQSQTGQAGSSVAGARAARALVNGFSWSLVWGSYEQRMVINGLLDV